MTHAPGWSGIQSRSVVRRRREARSACMAALEWDWAALSERCSVVSGVEASDDCLTTSLDCGCGEECSLIYIKVSIQPRRNRFAACDRFGLLELLELLNCWVAELGGLIAGLLDWAG